MIMNILIKMLFCILLITTLTSCSSDKIDNENPIDIDLVYSEEVKDFSNNQNFKEFLLPYSDSTADNNNFFAANIRIVKQSEFADNKFKEIFKVIEVLPKKGTGSIYTFENGNKIINDFIEQKKSEFDKLVTGAHPEMNYPSFIESIKNKKNVFIYFDEYSKSVYKDSTIYFFGKDSIKIFKDISALKQEIYRIHNESIKSTPKKIIKFTVLYNPLIYADLKTPKDSIKINLILLSLISEEKRNLAIESFKNLTKDKGILKLNVISKNSNYQKIINLNDSLQFINDIKSEININEIADRTTIKVIFNEILTKTEKDSSMNYFFILGDLQHTATVNLSKWKPLKNCMFIFGTNKHEFIEAFKTALRLNELKFVDIEKIKEII